MKDDIALRSRWKCSYDSEVGIYIQIQRMKGKVELILDFQGSFFCLQNAHKWMVDIVSAISTNTIKIEDSNNFISFMPMHNLYLMLIYNQNGGNPSHFVAPDIQFNTEIHISLI